MQASKALCFRLYFEAFFPWVLLCFTAKRLPPGLDVCPFPSGEPSGAGWTKAFNTHFFDAANLVAR